MGRFPLRFCGTEKRPGESPALSAGAVALPHPLPGGRALGAEQQPG